MDDHLVHAIVCRPWLASVPPIAASHGGVRVTNAAMDVLCATGMLAVGTTVWVH
jgi:hypothetical protein